LIPDFLSVDFSFPMKKLLPLLLIFGLWSQTLLAFSFSALLQENTVPALEVNSLDSLQKGFPVVGAGKDTLFLIYNRLGPLSPQDRANRISQRIFDLASNEGYVSDSLKVVEAEGSLDVLYQDLILVSVTQADSRSNGIEQEQLADQFRTEIDSFVMAYQEDNRLEIWALRIGLVLVAILVAIGIFILVQKGSRKLMAWVESRGDRIFGDFSYKGYTFLTKEQEQVLVIQVLKVLKWLVILIILYLLLPILFSIFPFSRDWSDVILNLVLDPVKRVLQATWNYLPNLFSILVIVFFMRYLIKFTKFIFHEIELEKLQISGFHADWAMPTYNIVRFLLYAFMLILIFPYLPGSDSTIFKGVSVFIGVLFSLGSSSAITNMIAGLVITYMRPFKPGDRIKIADVSGDVIEKTLLVTRIKTPKNEIITIPNSSVLTGNTVNYSVQAEKEGLILHTTITLGYDLSWKKVHQTLIDAALATSHVSKSPKPFVLQTSLDDFYVSYQLNAYTKQASKQALIYSELHQNIQDFCRDNGIEIMSPHYRGNRDGSASTIPLKEE
jgi:small-conductance mechanosensitive channel